jgi:hypothetical protein
MRLRLHPLFEGDAGGGTGGGTPPPPANDPAAAFSNLMARSSDAAALARQLFEENFRYRTELRDLQRQVPAQGAAVLTAEQAQAWQAYQQLGAPDQVQTTIQQAKKLQRDLELRDVAGVAGYSIDVLRTLAGELAFEVKDETKDGKAVKTVYVKGADGQAMPLETYAAAQWAAFMPALKPAQTAAGAPAIGATNPPGSHGATPPAQLDPKNPPKLSAIPWKS